jgi:hypothetical protein
LLVIIKLIIEATKYIPELPKKRKLRIFKIKQTNIKKIKYKIKKLLDNLKKIINKKNINVK